MTDTKGLRRERQLSIFEPQFDERIRRVEIDGVTHFSVLDVLEYKGSVGSADNPSKYWKRAEKRLRGQSKADIPGLVQHQFPGQRQRPTPVATVKAFLRIVQVVDTEGALASDDEFRHGFKFSGKFIGLSHGETPTMCQKVSSQSVRKTKPVNFPSIFQYIRKYTVYNSRTH